MSISRALGQKTSHQTPQKLHGRTPWRKNNLQKVEENVYGRMLPVAASPKDGGGARAPPPPPFYLGVPSARAGFFLYIYLSISTYLSLYIIYIYIYISLSLFLSRSSFWRGLRWVHVCATKLQ